MAPGTTAYRDANNAIAFNFPGDLEPGEYYMAVWADIWDNVVESNENDNISPSDDDRSTSSTRCPTWRC